MAPTHNLNSPTGEMSERAVHYFQSRVINSEENMRDNISDSVKAANTLQSVLRGEIPSAYMHLAAPGPYHRNNQLTSDTLSGGNMVIRQIHKSEHGFRPYTCSSPNRSQMTTLRHQQLTMSGSPQLDTPSVHDRFCASIYGNGSNYNSPDLGQFNDRCSPAIESRSSPFQESGSPFIGQNSSPYYNASSPHSGYSSGPETGSPYSPNRSTGSPYSPYLRAGSPSSPRGTPGSPYDGSHSSHVLYPSEGYTSSAHDTSDDQPMDLSRKTPVRPASNNSSASLPEGSEDPSGSLLRNLLTPGKSGFQRNENGRDSPCSDIYKPEIPITGTTRVTLAKKMVYPITSRVSDWLLKIVQFSKSIPEFASMSQNDKLTLLINAWTRMLLLLIAENEYEFAVTPLQTSSQSTGSSDTAPSQDEPTMKSVERIQTFIKKCKNMSMDQKEYALMRMAVLFNAGNAGLDDPELVEKLNSAVQQLLQQHVSATRPDDVMHYSRILMLLPSLYGINCRMVENLFCKRINTDMQVLLKEMLQNL